MNPYAGVQMQNSNAPKGKAGAPQMRRRRRKLPPPPPGQKSDQELIEAFIAQHGITRFPPGYAMGALKSTALGLDA